MLTQVAARPRRCLCGLTRDRARALWRTKAPFRERHPFACELRCTSGRASLPPLETLPREASATSHLIEWIVRINLLYPHATCSVTHVDGGAAQIVYLPWRGVYDHAR